jgi:hypothetical protein
VEHVKIVYNMHTILAGIIEDHLGDLSIDGRIILKCYLGK